MGIFNKLHNNNKISDDDIIITKENIDWVGEKCELIVFTKSEKKLAKLLNYLNKTIDDKEEWNINICNFCAKKLTGLANDWQYEADENAIEITKEAFAKNVKIISISIDEQKHIKIELDDKDYFGGHLILVDVDNNGNPISAELG